MLSTNVVAIADRLFRTVMPHTTLHMSCSALTSP